MVCSTWRHPDLGVMGGESGQPRHHHHPTHKMTGILEHACAKYEVYVAHFLFTIHERYTWTDRNDTYSKQWYGRANKIISPNSSALSSERLCIPMLHV